MAARRAFQSIWPRIALLIIVGAWPEPLFRRIAEPLLGTGCGELAVTAFECSIATMIGCIGGKAKSWRITAMGVLGLVAAIQLVSLLDGLVKYGLVTINRVLVPEGILLLLLIAVPAGLAHALTAARRANASREMGSR